MSKRYSGKSFKDSIVKKKPKLSFKKLENLKEKSEKRKNNFNNRKFIKLGRDFFEF